MLLGDGGSSSGGSADWVPEATNEEVAKATSTAVQAAVVGVVTIPFTTLIWIRDELGLQPATEVSCAATVPREGAARAPEILTINYAGCAGANEGAERRASARRRGVVHHAPAHQVPAGLGHHPGAY